MHGEQRKPESTEAGDEVHVTVDSRSKSVEGASEAKTGHYRFLLRESVTEEVPTAACTASLSQAAVSVAVVASPKLLPQALGGACSSCWGSMGCRSGAGRRAGRM